MELSAAIAKLSPPLRGLMCIKALMGGLSRSLLLPVLKAADIPCSLGQSWNPTALRAAEHTLRELGLTDLNNTPVPAVLHPLAEEGCRIPGLFQAFSAVLGQQTIESHRMMPVRLALRLSVYAGTTETYRNNRSLMLNLLPPDRKARILHEQFFEDAFDRAWLLARSPLMQADIFAEHALRRLQGGTAAAWSDTLSVAVSQADTLIPLLLASGSLAGLAGLHTLTLAGCGAAVLHSCRDQQTAYPPLAAQGVAAVFGNDPETGATLLREARKRLRTDMGKRSLPLDPVENCALALALLLNNEPKLLDELDKLLTATLDWPESLHGGLWAINSLLALRRGNSALAAAHLRWALSRTGIDPLSSVLAAVAQHCVDPDAARARRAEIAALHTRLDNLPVLAAMLAPVLREIAPDPAPYENPAVAAPDLVTPLSAGAMWERQLENLSHLLGEPNPRAASSRQRLIWLLSPETGDITPMQQTTKGSGWTAGRAVALKRLHESGPDQDWITEQDRRVIACIEWKPNWSGGVSGEFNLPRALNELVGHPLIFETGTREPLSLGRKDVELEVRENDRGFELTLPLPGSDNPFRPYRLVTCEGAVCTLHHLPETLTPAVRLLREGPLHIPRSGAAKVMAFIGRHADSIPLRTNMSTAAAQACARPVLRLSPSGTGLRVDFTVRPFAVPDSPQFLPGKGTRTPMAQLNGQLRQTRRDFDAERQAVEALLQACPTLDEHCDRETLECAPLDDMATTLQALLELQQAAALDEPPVLEWPLGQRFRVTPQVGAHQLTMRARKAGDWFQVSGTVALDEKRVLDMSALLERLGEASGIFVPIGDGEFLTLTRQLRRQLDRLARLSEADKDGARRIHPLGVGVVDDLLAETAAAVSNDEAWLARVRTLREADASEPELPTTLKADLRDYQLEGFQWLARLARWGAGACLADDMGLGKTVQTLALLLEQAGQGPALVVAPMSVCHNWESEAARFAPTLRVHRLGAAGQRAALVQTLGPGDVLITSYNLLQIEQKSLCSPLWRTIVFDEAQALKNAATKRARAARALRAACRVALTGTPIENELEDLWSLFNVINPGLLGTLPSFRKRFSAAGTHPGEERNPARQALKALVRPFILRRTKTAVLSELPPRTEQVLRVELSTEERALYEAMRRKAMDKIEQAAADKSGQRRLTILAELTRLRRACCHPVLVDPQTSLTGSKLEAFLELTRELRQGRHKALVFSQFVGHLALIRQALELAGARCGGTPPSLADAPRLPKLSAEAALSPQDTSLRGLVYQYLDGSTPEKERERAVSAFQDGIGDLFLISLKAGGQGLNLTAADYVLHLDPWWNPAVEDQASDRAHRMGQERPVTIYRLVAQDTVEERILDLHRAKRALAADFLSGAEAALSETDLLALFTEMQDA